MKLFFEMWPGDFRTQLYKLNSLIEKDNAARRSTRTMVKLISEREFGVFLGIFFIASLDRTAGGKMWDGSRGSDEGYQTQTNMGTHMSKHRHAQIRKYLPFIFANETKEKEGDPWWQVQDGIEEFNETRRTNLHSSIRKVLDESMSSFRPRTSPTGKYK